MIVTIDSLNQICKDTGLSIHNVIWLYYKLKDIPLHTDIGQNLNPILISNLYPELIVSADIGLINQQLVKALFQKYEYKNSIPISDNEILNIDKWIEEYRNLFKDKCTQAVPKGNGKNCIHRMKWFIDTYPNYANKEIIIKATKLGISTITNKHGKQFVPQADNFIVADDYKTKAGFPVAGKLYKPGKEYLVNYCEIVLEQNDSTTEEKQQVGHITF